MASRKMKNKLKHKTGAWLKNKTRKGLKRWSFFTPSQRRVEKKVDDIYDYTF